MPDRDLEKMTDQELLHEAVLDTEREVSDAAWSDTPPGEEPSDEAAAPEQETEQEAEAPAQPRNEKGQFASRAGPDDEAEQEEGEPQEQPEQEETDDANMMPRWRMKEIAEERRAVQAERDTLRAELIRMQTTLAQMQQGQQQQQQAPLDPLLDPQGFANQMRADMAREMQMMRLNSNLEIAHLRHGDAFEKAYEALVEQGQRGNHALVQRLTATANPGEAIVRWFKQEQLMAATGGDVDKYKEQLLQDPEFLQRAIETVRAQATGEQPSQPTRSGRPNNITRLPPSLSRASGGSPNSDPIDTDDSERSVFDYAFR